MRYLPWYSREFSESLADLDPAVRRVAEKHIRKVLLHPELGKPLHGRPGRFAERFMHFRIIYELEDVSVKFIRIGKRDEVYRGYSFG